MGEILSSQPPVERENPSAFASILKGLREMPLEDITARKLAELVGGEYKGDIDREVWMRDLQSAVSFLKTHGQREKAEALESVLKEVKKNLSDELANFT